MPASHWMRNGGELQAEDCEDLMILSEAAEKWGCHDLILFRMYLLFRELTGYFGKLIRWVARKWLRAGLWRQLEQEVKKWKKSFCCELMRLNWMSEQPEGRWRGDDNMIGVLHAIRRGGGGGEGVVRRRMKYAWDQLADDYCKGNHLEKKEGRERMLACFVAG